MLLEMIYHNYSINNSLSRRIILSGKKKTADNKDTNEVTMDKEMKKEMKKIRIILTSLESAI
jgi:hypothetical protein